MKVIIILLSITLFVMCSSLDKTPEHARQIHQIMSKFVSYAQQKYQLRCFGSGGSFMGNIKEVFFSFKTKGPMTLEEMRHLMVTIAEDFLKLINNNPDIRKYLSNYPFTAKNLEFSVTLYDTSNLNKVIKNTGSSNDLLCHVLLIDGKISYAIFNDDKIYYQKVFEESYEDAYKIVHKHF